MAMGGGGGNSKRGRPYGLMLLLALGAAVFGVMVLHRFKERRIFNLLIQDKDRHLLSLHLLVQKEKEATKEAKRKVEELKAKAYALRTQKMEFSNKMLEMQSLVSTLKEENRHLDSTLREQNNEMKKLKEKYVESNQEISQRTALAELLKQREVEIEELKRQVQKPTNVWSVSLDDPANPVVNSTLQTGVLSNAENSSDIEDMKSKEGGDEGAADAREHETFKETQPGKVKKSHDGKGQTLGVAIKDGVEQNMRHRSRTLIGSHMVDNGHRSVVKDRRKRIVPRDMKKDSKDIISENMRGSRIGENVSSKAIGSMLQTGVTSVDSKVVEADRFVYGKEQLGNSQDPRDKEGYTLSSVNDKSSGLAMDQKSDEVTKQAENQEESLTSENKYAGENEADVTGNRETQNFEAAHDVSEE